MGLVLADEIIEWILGFRLPIFDSRKINASENCHASFGWSSEMEQSKACPQPFDADDDNFDEGSKIENPRSAYSGLRNNSEGSIPIHSVGGKAATIQCKNPIGFQLFSQDDQSGIGEIHRHIAISFQAQSAGHRRDPIARRARVHAPYQGGSRHR